MSNSRVLSRTDELEFLYWCAHQVPGIMSEIRGTFKHIMKFQNIKNFFQYFQRGGGEKDQALGSINGSPGSQKTMEKMSSKLEFCTQTKYQSGVRIENDTFRYASSPKFTPLNLFSGSYWKLYCTKMKELAKKEKGREFRNQNPHFEGYPPVNGDG